MIRESSVRSISLPVVDVRNLVELFEDSRTVSCLDGRRRQDLDDAIATLKELLANGETDKVHVPVTDLRSLLRAAAATQGWMNDFFSNFINRTDE